MHDWYKKKFGDYALNWWSGLSSKREVEFLIEILQLDGSEKILDIGCGVGRHALLLSELGCQVTALDISKKLIDQAKSSVIEPKVGCKFLCVDVLDVDYESEFDVVLNLYDGAIGYFHKERNARIFEIISLALKSNGKHFTNLLDRDYYQRKCPFKTWKTTDSHLILSEYKLEEKTLVQSGNVLPLGQVLNMTIESLDSRYRIYTEDEVIVELEKVGLRVLKTFKETLFGAEYCKVPNQIGFLSLKEK